MRPFREICDSDRKSQALTAAYQPWRANTNSPAKCVKLTVAAEQSLKRGMSGQDMERYLTFYAWDLPMWGRQWLDVLEAPWKAGV